MTGAALRAVHPALLALRVRQSVIARRQPSRSSLTQFRRCLSAHPRLPAPSLTARRGASRRSCGDVHSDTGVRLVA